MVMGQEEGLEAKAIANANIAFASFMASKAATTKDDKEILEIQIKIYNATALEFESAWQFAHSRNPEKGADHFRQASEHIFRDCSATLHKDGHLSAATYKHAKALNIFCLEKGIYGESENFASLEREFKTQILKSALLHNPDNIIIIAEKLGALDILKKVVGDRYSCEITNLHHPTNSEHAVRAISQVANILSAYQKLNPELWTEQKRESGGEFGEFKRHLEISNAIHVTWELLIRDNQSMTGALCKEFMEALHKISNCTREDPSQMNPAKFLGDAFTTLWTKLTSASAKTVYEASIRCLLDIFQDSGVVKNIPPRTLRLLNIID